ncbi:MAG: T9SS type A sorting domain-containing protein [Chitinophagales bacterium]|nr:T9SS type A sorting domain-containing protein [Chitinophagales bacterium]
MKKQLLSYISTFVISVAIAQQKPQVPNGGFENWTGKAPTNWSTIESAADAAGFGAILSGKKFSTKETTPGNYVEGTTAVSIQNDDLTIPGQGTQIIPGILAHSRLIVGLSGEFDLIGSAFTGRPDAIRFSYKYVPVGADTASFFCVLTKFNSSTAESDDIGGTGEQLFATPSGKWDTLTSPIEYNPNFSGQNPDTLRIIFFAGGQGGAQKGSKLWVDNVRFIYNTSTGIVEVPIAAANYQVFPNPAQNIITIKDFIPASSSEINIYGLDGKVYISQKLVENNIQINSLPAGRYLFTISDNQQIIGSGNFSVVK